MQVIVSPSEPEELINILGENALVDNFAESIGADYVLFTNRGTLLIQRKTIPDLIASVRDGRLAKECAAMRQASEYRVVILEGKPTYTTEGFLRIGRIKSRWTKAGIRNLMRSIRYVEGVDIEWSDSIGDTADCLKELQKYFDQENHLSLRTRPKFESSWFTPTFEERFTFWLQGCGSGISIKRARAIAKVFRSPMEVFTASIDELSQIPGIGKVLATNLCNFLRGG